MKTPGGPVLIAYAHVGGLMMFVLVYRVLYTSVISAATAGILVHQF